MKKLLLLFAVLLTTVGAWAQEPKQITSLDDIDINKCYVIYSNEAAWSIKDDKTSLLPTGKNGAAWDKAAENNHFAFANVGDDWFVYSVGAKKFVTMDSPQLSSMQPKDAIEFVECTDNRYKGRVRIRFKYDTSKNIDINSSRDNFDFSWWAAEDEGTAFYIEEAGDLTPDFIDVTYNYKKDGEIVHTEIIPQFPGSEFNAPTFPYVSFEEYTDPGKVSAENKVLNLDCSISLPFEVSENYASAHWYFMTIHATGKYYLYHDKDLNYLDATKKVPEVSKIDAYTWAFVGNPFDGFKIINKAAGDGMVLSSAREPQADAEFPYMVTEDDVTGNTLWDLSSSSYATNGFFIAYGGTSKRLNRQNKNGGDKVCYWLGGADGGSTFLLHEVIPVTDIAYTLTDPAGNQYTGTYPGCATLTEPPLTGVAAYTLSNKVWNDGSFSANISFGITVSKEGEPENWTYISSGPMNNSTAYFYVSGTSVKGMSNVAGNGYSYLPTSAIGDQARWKWAIYPTLTDEHFTFEIKNESTGKYIQGTGVSNAVSVGDVPAAFNWVVCNNGKNGFQLNNNSNVFLSVGSSTAGEKNVELWSKGNNTGHNGANLQFPAPADFAALKTEFNTAKTSYEAWPIGDKFGKYVKNEAYASFANRLAEIQVQDVVNEAELKDLISKMNNKNGLTLYTTPYVYALKAKSAETYLSLIELETGYNGNANHQKSAAQYANEPTYFVLTSENNKGYVLSVYKMQNRYLGQASSYAWNASNTDKYSSWIIEPVEEQENTYYICKDMSGANKYLGNKDNANINTKVYTDQQKGQASKAEYLQWELVPMTKSVEITAAKAATLYTEDGLLIPEGVTAKYVKAEGENMGSTGKLVYTKLNDVIPANSAVVLTGEAGNYTFTATTEAGEEVAGNVLFGHATETAATDNTGIYALANKTNGVAFYPFVGTTYKAGKAYLNISGLSASEVRFFNIFDEDMETAIEGVEAVDTKSEIYDLAGRRVQNAQKGVFIVNGKVVIK